MSQPESVVLEPVADDGVGATVVGMVLWVIVGAACLIWRDELAARGAQWWAWTCLAGLGVGVLQLAFTRRRARVYRAHRAAQEAAAAAAHAPAAGGPRRDLSEPDPT